MKKKTKKIEKKIKKKIKNKKKKKEKFTRSINIIKYIIYQNTHILKT